MKYKLVYFLGLAIALIFFCFQDKNPVDAINNFIESYKATLIAGMVFAPVAAILFCALVPIKKSK